MSRLRIVLVCPLVPGNVGNIARSCTAMNAELHMVGPLGFHADPASLKRYSVGYWESLKPQVYKDFESFWREFEKTEDTEFYFATKRGENLYSDQKFGSDTVLIFGNEEEGVPESFWNYQGLARIVACRIPTVSVRCLNLSVAVGVMGFEVLRQWGKEGAILARDAGVMVAKA